MIFHIDIQTVLYTFILVHLVCGILGVAYGMQDKSSQMDISYLFARLLDMLGWVILILIDNSKSPYVIIIAISCIVIGMVLQIRTLLLIKGYFKKRIKIYYGISTILSLGFLYTICQVYWLNNYIVLGSILIVMLVFWCYPIYILLQKGCTMLQKVMGSVYIVSFIIYMYLVTIGLLGQKDLLRDGEHIIMLYSSIFTIMLIGNVGIILMSKEKADEKVRYQASYDELTNVMNRRSFLVTANNRLCTMKSLKKSVAFLLLDLDHFKSINDKYGHYVGDKVLKDFTKRVRKVIRDDDIFGRYGGEEFTILLSDIEKENSLKIASRILEEINSAILEDDLRYTVSIGMITLIPKEDTTIEELSKLADKALYLAKNNGRNRVETIGMEEELKVVMEQMNKYH